ncbi:MAG: ATP-binding protein [Thermodesulfovibrionales bacterium]
MIRGTSTFTAKIFFPILLLVLVIVSSTGYLYVLRQSAVIESGLEKRGKALVEILAKSLRVGISTRSDEYIDEALKNAIEVDDVLGVRVFDSDDRVLRYISRRGNLQQNIVSRKGLFENDLSPRIFNFERQLDLVAPVYYVESGIGSGDLEFYPVVTGKKVIIGYVELSLSKESIVSARKDVRDLGIITALFFCVFGGFIAYYIASNVTRPLNEFVRNIRDMQIHGLRKLPLRGPDEIREVSVAFNTMADILEKREQELHSLSSALSLTEERERRRIATDLHDNIGQTLALLKIKLVMVQEMATDSRLLNEVNELNKLVDESIKYSRSLMFDLSSPILHELGLVKAIEALTAQIGEKHGLQINCESNGDLLSLDDQTCTILYRAVRELFMNIVKHAKAKAVAVSIQIAQDNAKIRIEDNGIGFDIKETEGYGRTLSGSFGLFNIRELLKDIGGILLVESNPGRGTAATIVIPFIGRNE